MAKKRKSRVTCKRARVKAITKVICRGANGRIVSSKGRSAGKGSGKRVSARASKMVCPRTFKSSQVRRHGKTGNCYIKLDSGRWRWVKKVKAGSRRHYEAG